MYLYSYLYPKLTKIICLSYYFFCFLFRKIGSKTADHILPSGGREGVEVAQRTYTHVSKCKYHKQLKHCVEMSVNENNKLKSLTKVDMVPGAYHQHTQEAEV
jgi:hypothetical protein